MCKRKFIIHQICLFLFLLTGAIATAHAQVDTASITGQVTDAQGAVIGGDPRETKIKSKPHTVKTGEIVKFTAAF